MAYDNKWGYVWGSHGDVLTSSELKRLKKFSVLMLQIRRIISSHIGLEDELLTVLD